jgi:hypothetical protein
VREPGRIWSVVFSGVQDTVCDLRASYGTFSIYAVVWFVMFPRIRVPFITAITSLCGIIS